LKGDKIEDKRKEIKFINMIKFLGVIPLRLSQKVINIYGKADAGKK